MTTVYVVSACYDYEGGSPVAVFASKESAQELADKVDAYGKTKPRMIGWGQRSDEFIAKHDKWAEGHPLGKSKSCDYCDVAEVEML